MPNDADRAGTPAGVFGAELRFYRTRAGLSQKDLAARATVSHDVISKIETGERPPAEDFPPRLDAVPELDTRGALTRLWDHLKKGHKQRLDGWFQQWADIEAQATVLRWYEPLVVPGLLQTEQYARAILSARPDGKPGGSRRAGSRPAGPTGHFGPNGCPPALVHPRRGRPASRHRRQRGQPLLMSPAGKRILVEDRRGCLAGSGGDGDGIVYVVVGRAGAVAAGVLKAVPCPADPPERPEDAYCRAELGSDDLLHREMPAPAGCPQPLCLKQARGALAQGVIGQLVCPGQVSGYLGRRRGGKVTACVL